MTSSDLSQHHPPASILAACDAVDARVWGGDPPALGVHGEARVRAMRLAAMREWTTLGIAQCGRILGWEPATTYNTQTTLRRISRADRNEYLQAVYDELTKD